MPRCLFPVSFLCVLGVLRGKTISVNTLKIFCDAKLGEAELKLLTDGVAPHTLIFPEKPAASVLAKSERDPAFAEADIALGQPGVSSVLGSEKLRWVHLTSAGYTRYDTPEFREAAVARGLRLTNSSTVYAQPCAEHVFSFMVAQARQLPVGLRTHSRSGTPEWNALRYSMVSLRGQNVVILGFGAIASRLIAMLRPFEMNIVALRRKARGDEGVPIVTMDALPAALSTADHVVNLLPANADSDHFINAGRLASLKPGAVLYNIGRGTTVDQPALTAALQSGHIAAAWLDVTDPEPLPPGHPLLSAPNCHLTPHVAGGYADETAALVRHFLGNFGRFLGGVELVDRIM